MKRFFLKFVLFLSPFLICLCVELFVFPIDHFTFRVWEALTVRKFRNLLPGPFYPNMEVHKIEEGDLVPHTTFAIKRRVHWITDRYGYRKENTSQNPKIVIVGDSNIAGGGLTQTEMLSEVLEKQLDVCIYPLSPARMETFLKTKRFIEDPPQIVILGTVEREMVDLSSLKLKRQDNKESKLIQLIKSFREKEKFQSIVVYFDRMFKANMLHSLRARFRRSLSKDPAYYRKHVDSKFGHIFFLQGGDANQEVPKEERDKVIQVIKGYHNALRERGIRFIFLPIPNKESLFYELLNIPKPTFLGEVIERLKDEGIEVIDTQQAFEETYRRDHLLLYQSDDTHWNAEGVRLAAQLILRLIEVNP